jgi:hypothetical protein
VESTRLERLRSELRDLVAHLDRLERATDRTEQRIRALNEALDAEELLEGDTSED